MPQPVFSDVHVAAALNNIAVAYMQSTDAYIADKVFAIVPVTHQADKYFIWNKGDFFRDEARPRADGTESAGRGINLTTDSYSAAVYALHQDVGDQTRRNQDPVVDMDVTVTQALMQSMLITRDRQWVAKYFTSGVWNTDITGAATAGGSNRVYWSDDTGGDPFTDIADGQTTILTATGKKPNRLVIGWAVYQALRKNPLVVDRIKYTNPAFAGTITPQLLASAFDVEKIVVSEAVYNSAKEGQTASMSLIAGKNALLTFANPAPGLREPSAGYIFGWQGYSGLANLGVTVRQIPMPWLGQNTVRTEAEMAYDMKVVGTDLGYMFNSIVQ